MVNSQVVREVENAFKIDTRVTSTPNPIPVIEVGVKSIKNITAASAIASNATSATILTAPADRDLYIVGVSLSVIKDVTGTSTESTISATIEANTVKLISIVGISLTVQSGSDCVSFSHPIKVDKGSIVNVTNTTAVANTRANGTVYYFIDDIN